MEDDCLEKGSRGSRFTSAYNFEKSPWGKEEWNGTSCRRFSFLFSPSIVTCTCFPFFSFLTFESCYVPFKIGLSLYFLFLSCSKLPLISFCFLNSFSFQIYFYLFVPFSASSEKSNYDIQTALVICGPFICDFAYMRLRIGHFSGINLCSTNSVKINFLVLLVLIKNEFKRMYVSRACVPVLFIKLMTNDLKRDFQALQDSGIKFISCVNVARFLL